MPVKLIHIHIPKTGGRSLFRVLKSVYGDGVAGPINRGTYFIQQPAPQSLIGIIPPEKIVLYGHFHFKNVQDIVSHDAPKVITWMRHPVDRLISSYHFEMNKFHNNKGPAKHWVKANTQLMEFAENANNRNVQERFLKGLDLRDLFFIGMLEHHDRDLCTLSKLLSWKNYRKNVWVNKGFYSSQQLKKNPVTSALRKQIADLNKADMELYKEALSLRDKYEKNSRSVYLFNKIFKR